MPDRKLARVVTLKDGTKLHTISDAAAALEARLGATRWAAYEHLLEVLRVASEGGRRADVAAATDQLERVLVLAALMDA